MERYRKRLNSSSEVIKISLNDVLSTTDEIQSDESLRPLNISIEVKGTAGNKNALIARPRLQLAKARNAISVFSKAAEETVGALAIVGVLLNFGLSTTVHHDDCVALRQDYDKAVTALKKEEENLILLKNQVKLLYKNSVKAYKLTKELFLQITFVELVEKMETAFSKYPDIAKSKELQILKNLTLKYYLLSPSSLDATLQETSTKTIPKLLKEISCRRDETLLLKKVVFMCIRGNIKLAEYLEQVVRSSTKCNFKLKKRGILNKVKHQLLSVGKSLKCSQNNKVRKDLVCQLSMQGRNITYISSTTGFPLPDITYYSSRCTRMIVPLHGQKEICRKKKIGLSIQTILQENTSWNISNVINVYNNCKLSSLQIQIICNLKNQGRNLQKAQENFKLYTPWAIAQVYNKCVSTIWNVDKKLICLMKKSSTGLVDIQNFYSSKYSAGIVTEVFNQCT